MKTEKNIFLLNQKDLLHIIAMVLFFSLLGFLASYLFPIQYKATIGFDVIRVHQSESEDYRYDGYYAIRASELFLDNMLAWSKSIIILHQIFEQANVTKTSLMSDRFFKVKKLSPQFVSVSFSTPEKEISHAISYAYIDVMQEKTKQILVDENLQALFEVKALSPYIESYRPSLLLGSLIGCAIGIGMSLIYIYLRLSIYEDRN